MRAKVCLLSMPLILAAGCAGEQEGQSGNRGGTEPSTHSLEVPGDIEEGDTVVLTANDRVYTCTKTTAPGGESKVQCKDAAEDKQPGMALHRQNK